jgi:hypothetical protein
MTILHFNKKNNIMFKIKIMCVKYFKLNLSLDVMNEKFWTQIKTS